MDYQDIYYVDGRNATAVVDHRQPGAFRAQPTRFFSPVAVQPAGAVPMAVPPYQYPMAGVPSWAAPISSSWPAGWNGYAQPPYSYPPPSAVGVNNLTSILGGFGDLGSLANIAAQIFAAFLPLPSSPTPQDGSTGDSDPATNAQNNSSNLIRYQNALALFARRDQQILTVGSVLKELFKRPSAFGA